MRSFLFGRGWSAACCALALALGGCSAEGTGAGPRGPQGESGEEGKAGPAGESVVAESVDEGDANCPYGGSKLTAGATVTYACNGPPGPPNGPPGPKGDAGESVTITELAAGDPDCPNGGTSFEVGAIKTFACHGATGQSGSIGPQGPVGPKGNTGAQGATGAKGDTGAAGPKGDTGAQGAAGPKGDTGPAGIKGDTGAQGAQGPQGPPGAQGPAGSTGAQGPTGSAGPAGTLYGEQASTFAGFTTATTNGAAGGREAMHALCDAAFAGSHMCHVAEYEVAASATIPPSQGAWIDSSCIEYVAGGTLPSGRISCDVKLGSSDAGRRLAASTGSNCNGWTSAISNHYGFHINPTEAKTASCDAIRPVACCGTPYNEVFRGFTTATYDGAAGGRAAMHGYCASEFAGSHMCFNAEYERASSTATPPASGAWLDGSTYNSWWEPDAAMPRSGRSTAKSTGSNCNNWTSNLGNYWGFAIAVPEATSFNCDLPRPLACCGN